MERATAPGARPGALPAIPGVELVEVIGSGGSGVVYRGRQPTFDRDVAVKVVSSPGAPGAQDRWQRELAAMGRLSNHPNIVAVYAGGVTDAGLPYLVMPYLPDGTLRDRLERDGPMPPEEVASVGAKLAGVLAMAHQAGVLHRDVKPENVLISPYGEPQLTDFGIARVVDSTLTAAGALLGTIPYTAPEVVAGERATEASDVYGLGATLHACLLGEAPFTAREGETMLALATRVATQPPRPLGETGVPEPLARVVEKAMDKSPRLRHASASDLQHDLEAAAGALRGDHRPATTRTEPGDRTAPVPVAPAPHRTEVLAPITATDRGLGPPPRRPAPRSPAPARDNRALWAAVALVVLAVAGLLLWAVVNDDRQDTAAGEQPGTEVAEGDEPASPDAPATPTEEPEASDDAPPADAAAGGDMATVAAAYFSALDAGDFDAAWTLTSPRFQQDQDRERWQSFWGGFDRVDVVGALRVDENAGTVVVPVSFDGQREDYRLSLVQADDGTWMIDGPTG